MREDYQARIGTLIRDARRHQGLSQSDLAELRKKVDSIEKMMREVG